MPTRAQEYQEVRRVLGNPKNQSPSGDMIVSQLLRQEQLQLNKLNGTGKGWAIATTTIDVVSGTADYAMSVTTGSPHGIGKPLFVYRTLGNDTIMPVPMTDFSHEYHNQQHEFWFVPPPATDTNFYRSEKVAFWRTADTDGVATPMIRIYPVPDSDTTYTIAYAAGSLDPAEIALSDVPIMPEWSNLRVLETALYLLPYATWEGLSADQNSMRRKELAMSLSAQMADYREEFQGYLANPQHEPITDVGYWWE